MPVPRQTAQAAIKFIEGIVYRFGVPNRIITDNGTQFTSRAFLSFCEELGIKVCFASVSYPRCNGQVERANAEVLRGLKTKAFDKLENKGRNWIDHLPSVLWSIRTTPSRATKETPFFLVYGAEAVLPTELRHGSPGYSHMMKMPKLSKGSMTLTSWRKCAVGRHCGLLDTSKGCAGITAVRFVPGNYSLETW